MEEKSKTPIWDYYQSLSAEPRGTMGKFLLWLCLQTGMRQTGAYNRLKKEAWSPIERAAIMAAIENDSWRESFEV